DYFINKNGKKALLEDELEYNYYMPSSLYYFAQYLCWIQVLNTGVLRGILNVLRQVCKRRSKMDLGTQRSHLVVDHIEEGDWFITRPHGRIR
ncbi:MAG: hypothetical protein PHW78_02270, partial [Macromonas bipunctata]|nr:hypothetical protein [Macromonas bipunctata]